MRCVCEHTARDHDGDIIKVAGDVSRHEFVKVLGPCTLCPCPTFAPSSSDSSTSVGEP